MEEWEGVTGSEGEEGWKVSWRVENRWRRIRCLADVISPQCAWLRNALKPLAPQLRIVRNFLLPCLSPYSTLLVYTVCGIQFECRHLMKLLLHTASLSLSLLLSLSISLSLSPSCSELSVSLFPSLNHLSRLLARSHPPPSSCSECFNQYRTVVHAYSAQHLNTDAPTYIYYL